MSIIVININFVSFLIFIRSINFILIYNCILIKIILYLLLTILSYSIKIFFYLELQTNYYKLIY